MSKKIKSSGTVLWIDEVGIITLRVFNIIKKDKIKKTVVIALSPTEKYEIKKVFIRANRVIIYKKNDDEIVVQNPDKIGLINLDKKGIKTLRFNLQNSALQESKAAIYRWTLPKDTIDKLGPIFKLLFICIAVGVIGWAAFKYAGTVLELITRSRLLDCSQIMPKIPVPVGLSNMTAPIGA